MFKEEKEGWTLLKEKLISVRELMLQNNGNPKFIWLCSNHQIELNVNNFYESLISEICFFGSEAAIFSIFFEPGVIWQKQILECKIF